MSLQDLAIAFDLDVTDADPGPLLVPPPEAPPTLEQIASSIEVASLDDQEVMLWSVMRTFEAQASVQYRTYAPLLAVPKHGAVPVLLRVAGDDRLLQGSILAEPMSELVQSAAGAESEAAVLVVQGLVLERVRRVVYATLAGLPDISETSRSIAQALEPLSAKVVSLTQPMFAAAWARSGGRPFSLFAEASDDVLHKLDAVGEGVDEVFGERFGLRFADIVGEFVADLVPTCVELGMERRKVMSHLAGALMGI
jgi:hypothetical protein